MSDYVKNQLISITNCMNGGYPRWQSQYLRKLMMPDVNTIEESLAKRLLDAYQTFDITCLNDTMLAIVSSPLTKSRQRQPQVRQLALDFA